MKWIPLLFPILMFCLIDFMSIEGNAIAENINEHGYVKVEGSEVTPPIHPEKPEENVDPGEGPSTKGSLRIDYVSSLNFGRVKLTAQERQFSALAQQFRGNANPTGSYIQVTDQREQSTGWALQVKQNNQFRTTELKTENESELLGAVLSLDRAWVNSSGTSKEPIVSRDTVTLNGIGTVYEVANAEKGSGQGVWTIAFGASKENNKRQENTLIPVFDEQGKVVIDEFSGKPAYYNTAINLRIPKQTQIHAVEYQTSLTWLLATAP